MNIREVEFQVKANGLIPPDEVKLSPQQLRALNASLPIPEHTEKIGKAEFSIYKAKSALCPSYHHPGLRRLVLEARKAYQSIYGNVPLEDPYDGKSSIYLVRTQYPIRCSGKEVQIVECATLRFVPVAHDPSSTEDLDFYVYVDNGTTTSIFDFMLTRMDELNGLSKAEAQTMIATQSRFSAVCPYAAEPMEDEADMPLGRKGSQIPSRNSFSGLAFALMNKVYLGDFDESRDIRLITGQLHAKLSDKILAHPKDGQLRMPFTPAYELLRTVPDQIRVARQKACVYAYAFPGYFLNLEDLVQYLQILMNSGSLSSQVVLSYLPKDKTWQAVLEEPTMKDFRHMGELLTRKGHIDGSIHTGETLRGILDEFVGDSPLLRIMQRTPWTKGVNAMIEGARKLAETNRETNRAELTVVLPTLATVRV